jgi:methylenetetrahydrofolate reductase (NADPH)
MHMQKKLEARDFVILAELEPPKGTDVSDLVANATKVKGRVDAFVISEMGNAVMRLSALGGSLLLANRGLETVMQVCCRDRNRLALQGDLLAAAALGVNNVMAVSGEDITHGDHHRARAVNDVDLLELLGAMKAMKSGKDMAGVELKGSPEFFVGAAVNLSSGSAEVELAALDQKMAAGARFFVTTPIFDLTVLERFMNRLGDRQAYLIPTVLLLKSVGMARYIDRHMEHIEIPPETIRRLQNAPERTRECVQIAAELVAALKAKQVSGVNIATIGWEDKLPQILSAAGL